jgi:biopolymer transport protein ExbB/TolQ
MSGDQDEERSDPARKVIIAGLVVGGTMVTVGPMAGMVGTANGLVDAFGAFNKTETSTTGTTVDQALDEATAASNAGMAVAAVGGVTASICAVLLWRRTKALRANHSA